jgi:hypothetical protein
MLNLSRFHRVTPPAPAILWILLILLVTGATGCGDDRANPNTPNPDAATPTPDGGPVVTCPAEPSAIDPTALLDDFEHTGSSGAPLIAGRSGGWYASNDMTMEGIMQPLGDAMPEAIPGGRCGSRHAVHVTGSGFSDWGAVLSLAMHWGPNASGVYEEQPYDMRARNYQGVSFFARVGETSVNNIRYAVSDQFARPEAGLCNLADNSCYSTYGIVLNRDLDTQWKEFRIPWVGLTQEDFGIKGGDAGPDPSKIYDIQFTFPPRVVFDLWVDDVRFY